MGATSRGSTAWSENGVRTAGRLGPDSLRPIAELNAASEVTSVFLCRGYDHVPSVVRRDAGCLETPNASVVASAPEG